MAVQIQNDVTVQPSDAHVKCSTAAMHKPTLRPHRLLDAVSKSSLIARAKKIQKEMVDHDAGILPRPPAKEPKETPRDFMTGISSKMGSKFQRADKEEGPLRGDRHARRRQLFQNGANVS